MALCAEDRWAFYEIQNRSYEMKTFVLSKVVNVLRKVAYDFRPTLTKGE